MSRGNFCCMVGCPCSSSKCRGLSFHSIPKQGVSEEQDEWRRALINKINRVDKGFNPKAAKICSRHFEESCFKYGPSGVCTGLILGSLPTRWMPSKTIETPKTSRSEPSHREPPQVPVRVCYYSFNEIQQDIGKVTSPWSVLQNSTDCLMFGLVHNSTIVIKVSLYGNMQAFVEVHGIPAVPFHTNLEFKKVHTFLSELQQQEVCKGITSDDLQEYASLADGTKTAYFRHVISETRDGRLVQTSCIRPNSCLLLQASTSAGMCTECKKTEKTLVKRHEKKQMCTADIKPNNPLRSVSDHLLKEAFKKVRNEKNKCQKELNMFRRRMAEEGVKINEKMHNELKSAVDFSCIKEPLVKLFWEEQEKAFKAKDHGMRWHPMMIRLAILLHSRGKAAYDTLQKTGVLKLPGSSTLRDYTSAVHPEEGFQPEVMEELKKRADRLEKNQRFVVLLHDEMSIRSDLVFDRRSGELVGFVNRDTWSFEGGGERLASQALVFYIVGVNSDLKMSIGFFGTRSATADQLYPLFWEAVGAVEDCGLKVIISTSDKAPANQRLYQLHSQDDQICHKTVNMFAPERNIYFISDPPHLIKTVRNNLASSGSGRNTKLFWKDDQYLLWRHIAGIYQQDLERGLTRTRLTLDHIHLTPHSVMRVNLAAQTLSQRVGRVLEEYGPQDAKQTARFILLMDRFFDCLNSRNLSEADRKRKPDLKPYISEDDPRFNFLEEEFLGYLNEWRAAVEDRPGQYTKLERQKMFLTHQTYKGLVMTVRSFVEVTRYLLANGVEFVLSNKFCQDPLEEHFGRHRGLGHRAENPNVFQFGHQEQKLRLQRTLALSIQPKGNVSMTERPQVSAIISVSPVKKKSKN